MFIDLTVAGKNKEHLILVEYEVSPAEPDVGDYGNGKEVITGEAISLKMGTRLRLLTLPYHSWLMDYVSGELYEGLR